MNNDDAVGVRRDHAEEWKILSNGSAAKLK